MQKLNSFRAQWFVRTTRFVLTACCLLVLASGCTKMQPGGVQNLLEDTYQSKWPSNNQPTMDTSQLDFEHDTLRAKLDRLTESTSSNKAKAMQTSETSVDHAPAEAETQDDAPNVVLAATTEPPPQVMNRPLQPLQFDAEQRELTKAQSESLREKDEKIIVLSAQPKTLSQSPSAASETGSQFIIEDPPILPMLEKSQQEPPKLSAAIQPSDQPENRLDPRNIAIDRTANSTEIHTLNEIPNTEELADVPATTRATNAPEAETTQMSAFDVTLPQLAEPPVEYRAELSEPSNAFVAPQLEIEIPDSTATAEQSQSFQPYTGQPHSDCPGCKDDCVCPLVSDNAFVIQPNSEAENTTVSSPIQSNPELPLAGLQGSSWLNAQMPTPPTATPDSDPEVAQVELTDENSFIAPVQNLTGDSSDNRVQHAFAVADSSSAQPMKFGLTTDEIAELEEIATAIADAEEVTRLLQPTEIPTPDAAEPIAPANPEPMTVPASQPKTWQSHLQSTIDLLQQQIDATSDTGKRAAHEIDLRLLQILKRRAQGLNYANLSPQLNQYWNHQTRALTSMLDTETDGTTDIMRHRKALQTLDSLRSAVQHLETIANLRLARPALCTEVSGYGQVKQFQNNTFEIGQKFLVYCEVENFTSLKKPTANGASFHTRLRASLVIYDADGNAVQQAEFPTVEDIASNKRRDFYMYMPVTLGKLKPGTYKLHLLVEDIDGNKTASLQDPISFAIQ